jgi:hypothetical protein
MSVFVNTPAMFLPGQEIIVPVKSKNDVHVLQVMQIGAEKP